MRIGTVLDAHGGFITGMKTEAYVENPKDV